MHKWTEAEDAVIHEEWAQGGGRTKSAMLRLQRSEKAIQLRASILKVTYSKHGQRGVAAWPRRSKVTTAASIVDHFVEPQAERKAGALEKKMHATVTPIDKVNRDEREYIRQALISTMQRCAATIKLHPILVGRACRAIAADNFAQDPDLRLSSDVDFEHAAVAHEQPHSLGSLSGRARQSYVP